MLDVQAALQAISTAAGDNITVDDAAVSVDPSDWTPDLLIGTLLFNPALLVLVDNGRPINYSPASQKREDLPLTIIAAADVDPQDPLAKLRMVSDLYAAVERALEVDPTRGGLATDTRIADKQHDAPTGTPRVLVIVQVLIRVHRPAGDPYS